MNRVDARWMGQAGGEKRLPSRVLSSGQSTGVSPSDPTHPTHECCPSMTGVTHQLWSFDPSIRRSRRSVLHETHEPASSAWAPALRPAKGSLVCNHLAFIAAIPQEMFGAPTSSLPPVLHPGVWYNHSHEIWIPRVRVVGARVRSKPGFVRSLAIWTLN